VWSVLWIRFPLQLDLLYVIPVLQDLRLKLELPSALLQLPVSVILVNTPLVVNALHVQLVRILQTVP
jgi:hypothetical protein